MRDMIAKLQDGYKKKQCEACESQTEMMHEKKLVKPKFLLQFRSIEQQVRLIENLEK